MDDSISETESAPEAQPAPVFDATPWPVAKRPAAPPPRRVRISRDLGPRLWTAALASALLFTAGGLALLYLDDTNAQNAANQLNSQNQALKSQNQQLQAQLLTTQTNLSATLAELATVRVELEHPNLTIWNVPQQINGPNWYLAGGAPDTFTYHLRATSTGPMSISILTLEDFVKAIDCVQNGAGPTHYCMHHSGAPARLPRSGGLRGLRGRLHVRQQHHCHAERWRDLQPGEGLHGLLRIIRLPTRGEVGHAAKRRDRVGRRESA